MKNKIKILSVLILILFASSLAMPLFAYENCEMPKVNESAIHCNMEDMDCCEVMTACVVVPFFPLTSMSINKVELQKDLEIDYFVNSIESSTKDLYTNNSSIQDILESCNYDFHPGFQTPLLA